MQAVISKPHFDIACQFNYFPLTKEKKKPQNQKLNTFQAVEKLWFQFEI